MGRSCSAFVLEGEFQQYYRMSYAGFERLLSLVGADLAVDPLQSARRALGEPPVAPAGMLQTCISCLAGGSYHHFRVITGTSRAGFYRIVHAVLRAINGCNRISLQLPTTNSDMEHTAAGFRALSRVSAIPGCIGVIDGWLCPIRVPRSNECGRVTAFFSGHYQRYGLNVQACADYSCRFTAMSCRAPGGRNDCIAYMQWPLSRVLREIRGPYFVIGDNVYQQTRVVLTPFNQAQLKGIPDRDKYNFCLIQCRIRIEMAFGLLVNKWRILKTPLCGAFKNTPHVIHACMRLHNFCIDQRGIEYPDTVRRMIKAIMEEVRTWNGSIDLSYSATQYETEGGDVVELLDETAREFVVQHIASKDLHRPRHNCLRRTREELLNE